MNNNNTTTKKPDEPKKTSIDWETIQSSHDNWGPCCPGCPQWGCATKGCSSSCALAHAR